jgi:hypothetical protein
MRFSRPGRALAGRAEMPDNPSNVFLLLVRH